MLTYSNSVETQSPPAPNKKEDASDIADYIPQDDPVARREKMTNITELSLKRIEDKKLETTPLGHNVQDITAGTAKVVTQGMEFIKEAIKDVPYASVITAGISLVLPLLESSTTEKEANWDGFTYITSQLRYYTAMEDLLLPEDLDTNVKYSLAKDLVDLYKHIISFQLRSILWFYRSRIRNYLRGVMKYDGWEGQLEDIKNIDRAIISRCQTAIHGSSLQKLSRLASQAEQRHIALQGCFDSVLGELQRIRQDPKDEACLQGLRITDPRHDKKRIEQAKGGLLEDSYRWVLDHADFREWHDNPQSRLLWIEGDPGKGKTMLLCGIINELEKSGTRSDIPSFFFCQATDSRINTATAMLRGLLYLLVVQNRSVLPLIQARYENAGKRLFEDVNAWVALSEILTSILQDLSPNTTYLIIDALDECITDRNLLLDFIIDISASCPTVKWVVSSRN